MDLKTLLPDFEAIGKTDWSKPKIDTKDSVTLFSFIASALMVVFVFLSWIKLNATLDVMGVDVKIEGAKMGVESWYGVCALICGLLAVVGCLYQHVSLTFSAAVLGLVFGIVGYMSFPEVTVTGTFMGMSRSEVVKSLADWKEGVEEAKSSDISHLGAILYMVASAIAALIAYKKITTK